MFKNRSFLYFFIIFFIIIALVIQYIYIKQEEEQIIKLLKTKSEQMDKWLLKDKKLLEKLSKNLERIAYNKEVYLELMKKTNKKMGTNSIFIGFKNGIYIDTQGYWIDNFDPRKRPWYIETFENKKTTISGPMYYNDISGQRIVWWSISSILLKNNKPFGVISSEILPDMIIEHFNDVQTDDFEHLFLFHKKTGIIVSAINRDKELKYIQEIFSKEVFEKFQANKNKISFLNQGLNKIAYLKSLEEAPWILCVIKSH